MTAHTTPVDAPGARRKVIERSTHNGALGWWEVMYYRASGTINEGELVAEYQLSVTDVDSGAVGSTTKAAAFHATADIYVGCGGVIHIDDDNGGAGAAPEGESALITASVANTVTHTNLTAATAANDDVSIHAPFLGVQAAATDGANIIGLALTDVTVGQYGFALRRGFHPDAEVVTTTAVGIGVGLIPAAGGQLTPYTGAETYPPVGHAVAARLVGEVPTSFPVMMTLP
jgi:hypothetical protein